MGELNDQAKELKRLLDTISPALRRFGLDVYNSERKLRNLQHSPEYGSMMRRNALDASMERIRASLDRYAKLVEADRVMRASPGKFGTSAQALEYQRRMAEIADPQYGARNARIARYGARGASEIARAENKALFARDTMDAFEREKYGLTQRYGGDTDLAEKKMRMDVLKKLPDFFKDTKISVRELRGIAKSVDRIPGYASMKSSFDSFKEAGGAGSFGGKLTAIMAALDLAKKGINLYSNKKKEQRDTRVRARSFGWDTTEFSAANQIMMHRFGSSAESYLAPSKSYAANMGRLKSGMGGTEFLDALAPYLNSGDLIGSGFKGLPTAAEMRRTVAEKLKRWGREDSKEYDYDKARALLEAYGGDDAFFNAALDYGKDIDNKLRHNRVVNKVESMNMKGAEEAGNYLLSESLVKRTAEGGLNVAAETVSSKSFFERLINFVSGKAGGAIGGALLGPVGFSLGHALDYNREKVKKAEEAAKSADTYEKNKTRGEDADGANKASPKVQQIAFNFTGVEVKADNPEEFVRQTAQLSAERIQRNKSVLAAFDMMEVA